MASDLQQRRMRLIFDIKKHTVTIVEISIKRTKHLISKLNSYDVRTSLPSLVFFGTSNPNDLRTLVNIALLGHVPAYAKFSPDIKCNSNAI